MELSLGASRNCICDCDPRDFCDLSNCLRSITSIVIHGDGQDVDLSAIPAEAFGKAMAKIKDISVRYCDLTTEQYTSVFTELKRATPTIVERLELSRGPSFDDELMEVDAVLMGKALSRVKTVDVSGAKLTGEQYVKIVEESSAEEPMIVQELHLPECGAVLTDVGEEVLDKALTNIKIYCNGSRVKGYRYSYGGR